MTYISTEQPEAQRLTDWFEESGGFNQGTKAPHKWALQAEQELIRLHAREQELKAIRKAACKAYNTWVYADDTFGEVTQAMHALADAINGITQEKQG